MHMEPIIGSPFCPSVRPSTFLKPCEDLVKTVNVVNVEPSCTAVRLHVFLVLVNSIEQELKIQ